MNFSNMVFSSLGKTFKEPTVRFAGAIAMLAMALMFVFAGFANAGEYCTTAKACKQAVRAEVAQQNLAASSGKQWGPVGRSACEVASREQEGNEKRCRSYDKQAGGKTQEQCAKCYRQVVLDLARWEQCYKAGYAPKPPQAIYDSLARLGKAASK